jgi:hypothetical protein
MDFLLVFLVFFSSSPPLLDVEDSLDRGATAIYSVSLQEGTEYWLVLEVRGTDSGADFDVIVAGREMNLEHFMNLPYREDFEYAHGHACAAGTEPGNESLTLSADYTGVYYIVVHDVGQRGGSYRLKLQ